MEAEYPIIDNPKKDKLVEECLKAGWTWEKWNNEGTNMVLLPPKGDDRRTWCAYWSPWKDKFHMIPHWADPVDPTLKDEEKA